MLLLIIQKSAFAYTSACPYHRIQFPGCCGPSGEGLEVPQGVTSAHLHPLLEKTSTQQLTRWTQQQMDTPATKQPTHIAGSKRTWTPVQLTCSFNAGRWSLFQQQHAQIEAANFHHFLHSGGTWEKAHSQIEIQYLQ